MMISTALLSQSSGTAYDGLGHYVVSSWTWDNSFFWTAIAMLVLWLVLIVISTAMLFHPTISSSLNSYTAAKLMAQKPELLDSDVCKSLEDNQKLLEKFEPINGL